MLVVDNSSSSNRNNIHIVNSSSKNSNNNADITKSKQSTYNWTIIDNNDDDIERYFHSLSNQKNFQFNIHTSTRETRARRRELQTDQGGRPLRVSVAQ